MSHIQIGARTFRQSSILSTGHGSKQLMLYHAIVAFANFIEALTAAVYSME
jgi:hypothetical protein